MKRRRCNMHTACQCSMHNFSYSALIVIIICVLSIVGTSPLRPHERNEGLVSGRELEGPAANKSGNFSLVICNFSYELSDYPAFVNDHGALY
jgi:hypothetical protein